MPIALTVGDVTQTIEISGRCSSSANGKHHARSESNSQSMTQLPLGGQRIFHLSCPLVTWCGSRGTGARDAVGGGFSANGVRSNGQNNFLLNGVDNNVNVIDFLNQTAYVVGPSVEAIGEIQILTNGYGARYGRGAGGVLNINLKSGTNQLHGTLWKNPGMTSWTQTAGNSTKPERYAVHSNRINSARRWRSYPQEQVFHFWRLSRHSDRVIGGSIQNLGYGGFYTIPTPAMVKGDFSEFAGIRDPDTTVRQGQIFDPASTRIVNGQQVRDPFPGNIIPPNRFDPSSAKIMALYPVTNQPIKTGAFPQNDYFVSTPGSQTTNQAKYVRRL